jgi:hypothetical protein
MEWEMQSVHDYARNGWEEKERMPMQCVLDE